MSTDRDRLEAILGSDAWEKPAARELALWLETLTAPSRVLWRPAWAAQVAYAALRRRRRVNDG